MFPTRTLFAALLLIALLATAFAADERSTVVTYPLLPTCSVSDAYQLTVGGQSVPVLAYKDIHYAHFSFDGTAEVKITIPEPIEGWSLSPKRYRIPTEVSGKEVALTLSDPRKLVFQANDFSRLFLFADPLDGGPVDENDPSVVNILDFGIDNTGLTVETERLQNAIDTVPKEGVLFFPPGLYRTGGLSLKSDMTLYLSGGAMIQGTNHPRDYRKVQHKTGSSVNGLLVINDSENVVVAGRGVLDGNGAVLRPQGYNGRVLLVRNSRNIRIEGILLRDSPSWNTHMLRCENITLRNLKQINDLQVPNTDGFDPDASSQILIEDCFAYCGDDTVAVKCTGRDDVRRDVRDIMVRRNVFLTKKSALKVGTESRTSRMGDITFEDNDILFCDRGMTLYCRDGATYENIRFVGNRFEDFHRDSRQRLLDFEIIQRDGKGRIRDILIRDCQADLHWPRNSTMRGLDEDHLVEKVRFENLQIAGKPCHDTGDADLDILEYVKSIEFAGASSVLGLEEK